MLVAVPRGGRVARPTVGDHVAARFNIGVQERGEADCTGIVDNTQANPAEVPVVSFDGASDKHFPECSTATYARFWAADEGFVDLHVAAEALTTRSHHDRPVPVQHHPRGLDRSQLHLTLHLDRRDSHLVPDHPPGHREPHRQRGPGLIENRARRR